MCPVELCNTAIIRKQENGQLNTLCLINSLVDMVFLYLQLYSDFLQTKIDGFKTIQIKGRADFS
jgi:hypothetical protein